MLPVLKSGPWWLTSSKKYRKKIRRLPRKKTVYCIRVFNAEADPDEEDLYFTFCGWNNWAFGDGAHFGSREYAESQLMWLCAQDPTIIGDVYIEKKTVIVRRPSRRKRVPFYGTGAL